MINIQLENRKLCKKYKYGRIQSVNFKEFYEHTTKCDVCLKVIKNEIN